jgi:hypothetical protein
MSHLLQHPTLILTIRSVEVYQRYNEITFTVGSGPLFVYYYLQSNSFVIQTNNFSYTLSKEQPVYSSPPHHGQLYPSYIFPANQSYFVLRITDNISSEALSSFESILNNHSHLSYREEPEIALSELGHHHHNEPNLENEPMIQLEEKINQPHSSEKESNLITKGGELTRLGLIWSAALLARGIAKLGGFVENKCTTVHEEKEVKPSITDKLSTADSATQTALIFTKIQAKGLLGAGKRVGEKIMDSELGHKFEHSKYHDSVTCIGKSSMYAAACIYDGWIEALTLIGRGIRDTTAHAVSNRYGEKVGDATKQGFNVIGNLGKIVTVYKEEANEYIHEQNGTGPVQNMASYETKFKSD